MNYSASILVTSILFFVFGHFQKGPRGRRKTREQSIGAGPLRAELLRGFIWMNCIGSDNAEEVRTGHNTDLGLLEC